MRTSAAALAAAITLVLAGCGGGGGTSKDAAGVRATIHEFANDLLSGNFSGACSLFTTSALTHTFGSKSRCEQLLGEATKHTSKQKLQQEIGKIDNTPVTIHGDTATVPNTSGSGSTTLVYENGHWLIGSK